MKEIKIKNGILEIPNHWLEANPEEAIKNENVVIAADGEHVTVIYTEKPAWELDLTDEEKVRSLAANVGLVKEEIRLYGLIEENLGISNVENARIVRGGMKHEEC